MCARVPYYIHREMTLISRTIVVWLVAVIALPLAAGILAGIGFVLPAWVGALLMSLSTIIVAFNAQTLRRLDMSVAQPISPILPPAAAAA